MSMVQSALICCLVYFILSNMDWFTSLQTFKRPIVVAPLTGLLLGDFETGIIMGASLEGIFMGISAIGGSIPADSTVGSIIAVAYAITTGATMEEGLAIAMPIGTLISSFGAFTTPLFAATSPYWEKLAGTGNMKKFTLYNVVFTAIFYNIISMLILFFSVAYGTTALFNLLESVPAFVTTGLSAASGIMMGVGYAILLSMLWRGDIAYYFIAGYVLSVYLNVPTLGVALVGVVIAISVFVNEKRFMDMKNVQIEAKEEDEEDFFNE